MDPWQKKADLTSSAINGESSNSLFSKDKVGNRLTKEVKEPEVESSIYRYL